MSQLMRLARFTGVVLLLLVAGMLTFGGCTGSGLSVRPNASIPLWSDRYGLIVNYAPPDVCVAGVVRSDTTASARVDTLIGPLCLDAHEFVRRFFGSDTTSLDTTAITGR